MTRAWRPPFPLQVHVFKRAENAWTYTETFASYVYGMGIGSADVGFVDGNLVFPWGVLPVSVSHDGKVILVGSGFEAGAATLITHL